jgi:hypothetical protein
MNERIQELAEQCGFKPQPSIYDRNQSFDIEKFAKLIIQDCVAQVALVGISNTSFEDDGVGEHISWACSKSIECIKEHFGVKE